MFLRRAADLPILQHNTPLYQTTTPALFKYDLCSCVCIKYNMMFVRYINYQSKVFELYDFLCFLKKSLLLTNPI